MDERETIEEKLRKKQQEVRSLDDRLRTARIYVQALQDVLKSLDKSRGETAAESAALKPGSAVAQARSIILDRGEPVHINALLEAMGKDTGRESRASLTSSLSAYVRKGDIFTRPAPNTFGLIELGHETIDENECEPPSDFGEIELPRRAPAPPHRRPPSASPKIEEEDDIPF